MMVVSTDQWCPEFGSSYCHSLCLSKCKWDNNHMFLDIICIYFLLLCKVLNTKSCLSKFATKLMFHWEPIIILYFLYLCFLQLVHGDIKSNPRTRHSKNHLPSFCHWKLNSLPAHSFAKMLLLKACNVLYISKLLCLSETYRDSSIPSDHNSLDLESYKLFCTDHPYIKLNQVEIVFTIRNLCQLG